MAFSTKLEVFVLQYQKINSYPARGNSEEQILREILGYINNLILTHFIGK